MRALDHEFTEPHHSMTATPKPMPSPMPEGPPSGSDRISHAMPRTRRRRGRLASVLALALLSIHSILALSSARHQSPTFDELIHLSSGLSYWVTNDYRLHPENGNFPQRWAALPLRLSGAKFSDTDSQAYRTSAQWVIARQVFYKLGNDPERIILAGRAMIVLLSVALGVLVFAWSRRLFGDAGGLVSLTFYSFSPTVLTGATLVTSDMAMALALLLATGAVWRVCHRVTPATVSLAGLAVGLLAVSKMSAPLIVPIAAIMVAASLIWRAPMNAGFSAPLAIPVRGLARRASFLAIAASACAVIAILVVWASFGFRYATFATSPQLPAAYSIPWDELNRHIGDGMRAVIGVMRSTRLLPEAYLYGLSHALGRSAERQSFLNGGYSVAGWPSFFLYTFAVKTTLTSLLAIAAAIVIALPGVRSRLGVIESKAESRYVAEHGQFSAFVERVYPLTPLFALLIVYWIAAVGSTLNIGHRHLLPTYPAMFILLGSLARLLRSIHILVRVQPWSLAALVVMESLIAWPDYLSYFNPIIGRDNAYRHVVDSSLDWGQDLYKLRTWMREKRTADVGPVYLSYFGSALPSGHGIDAIPLPSYFHIWREPRVPIELKPGWYCVSATILQGLYQDPWGPWDAAKEAEYQHLRPVVEAFRREHAGQPDRDALASPVSASLPASAPAMGWPQLCDRYEWLRVGRLCAVLRKREPDTRAGASILIYRVSANELHTALDGPPLELRENWTR